MTTMTKQLRRYSIGIGVGIVATGAYLMGGTQALAHCCYPHPLPPYDQYCCDPATTVVVAPAVGVAGVAGVRGTARRTSRRVSRRR